MATPNKGFISTTHTSDFPSLIIILLETKESICWPVSSIIKNSFPHIPSWLSVQRQISLYYYSARCCKSLVSWDFTRQGLGLATGQRESYDTAGKPLCECMYIIVKSNYKMLICHMCLWIYLMEIKCLLCLRSCAYTVVPYRRSWHDSFQETQSFSRECNVHKLLWVDLGELGPMY